MAGVAEFLMTGENVRHGADAFGVELSASPVKLLHLFAAEFFEAAMQVQDALAESASVIGGVQFVAGDACDDAGVGDLEAQPVAAVCLVGDPGELQGGVLVPAHCEELLAEFGGVGVGGLQGVDRLDLCVEAADEAFGVNDLSALGVA